MSTGAEAGVFGCSGLYEFFTDPLEVSIETPYGASSDRITIGEVSGHRVAFLPRHGRKHWIPAHAIPYRANVWAMKELGVTRLISPSTVTSLDPEIAPGTFVICDQLVDLTRSRRDTFFDGPKTTHVGLADPFCPQMYAAAIGTASELGINFREAGTIAVIEGPRLSTKAEAAFMARQGWEVVSLTQYPEAALAREVEVCFVNLSIVTGYAPGIEGSSSQDESDQEVLTATLPALKAFIEGIVKALPGERNCPCGHALRGTTRG